MKPILYNILPAYNNNNNNKMTEQTNKITMEEVFGDFNYDDVKDYKNNHLCIDVGMRV